MRVVFYFLLVVMFSGCVGSMGSRSDGVPNWYLKSPQNDSDYIYGVGEGMSLKSAKADALNDMASRLSVGVESTYTKNTSSTNKSFKVDSKESIRLAVERIDFTNAKVKKTTLVGKKSYILIVVDRDEFFKKLFNQLKIDDTKIDYKVSSVYNYPNYDKFIVLKKIKPLLLSASLKVKILKVVNGEFKELPYLEKYSKIESDIDKIKQNLTFTVVCKTDPTYAKEVISKIAKSGYSVKDNSPLKIVVIVDKVLSKYKGWYVYRNSVKLHLKSKGKILSSQSINTKGLSVTKKNAYLQSAKKFGKKIDFNRLIFNE